eukprot:3830194-Amphidinium_carterae.1
MTACADPWAVMLADPCSAPILQATLRTLWERAFTPPPHMDTDQANKCIRELTKSLANYDPEVRRAAARLLESLGHSAEPATSALAEALKDDDIS